MSPTQRTLKALRDNGYVAEVVERFNSFTKRRIDFMGCADIIGFKDGAGILAVQTCRGGDHATRRTKIEAEPRAQEWLRAGGRLEVWSWAKQGARGKRKVWTARIEAIKGGAPAWNDAAAPTQQTPEEPRH